MSQFGLKLTIWWSKQSSVIEKVKPHRARILFWKSAITCPKWFAVPDFLFLAPIMAQVEHAPKNEQDRTKIDGLVTKTMFGDRKS